MFPRPSGLRVSCGLGPETEFHFTPGQRALRELTRHRTNFVRELVNLGNRLQTVLESANIKLKSVAPDVLGMSGRVILDALVERRVDPTGMAELANGRTRNKRDLLACALEGHVLPHHHFILTELLGQIDKLDETIEHFNARIAEHCHPFEQVVVHRDTIIGIGPDLAQRFWPRLTRT